MKRASLPVLTTLALVLGLSGPVSAAGPQASCQGLAASSLAGQPGAFAQERHGAFEEAEDLGFKNVGALTSAFARQPHPGSLAICFGPPED